MAALPFDSKSLWVHIRDILVQRGRINEASAKRLLSTGSHRDDSLNYFQFWQMSLVHKSVERSAYRNYELLEFLGDAHLNDCLTTYVFRVLEPKFPQIAMEPNGLIGMLTDIKQYMIGTENVSKIGRCLGLDQFIIIDPSEGGVKDKHIEDVTEAFFGCLNSVARDMTKEAKTHVSSSKKHVQKDEKESRYGRTVGGRLSAHSPGSLLFVPQLEFSSQPVGWQITYNILESCMKEIYGEKGEQMAITYEDTHPAINKVKEIYTRYAGGNLADPFARREASRDAYNQIMSHVRQEWGRYGYTTTFHPSSRQYYRVFQHFPRSVEDERGASSQVTGEENPPEPFISVVYLAPKMAENASASATPNVTIHEIFGMRPLDVLISYPKASDTLAHSTDEAAVKKIATTQVYEFLRDTQNLTPYGGNEAMSSDDEA